MTRWMPWCTLGLLVNLLAAATMGGEPSSDTSYKMGYAATMRFGHELYRALKPKFQPMVDSRPIHVDTSDTPYARIEENLDPEVGRPLATVAISAGFIDLVNNVAHARAIDKIEKGYFQKYVLSLAQESGDRGLRELPNLGNPKYWTEEMMNEQLSCFNQIVGVMVGTKLAHYYRGHYQKHASALKDAQGNPVPINSLLTPDEWDDSLKWGVVNSLDCALGIDGIKALFDAIDRMPKRPAWTLYFLPANVKVSKCKKDMEKIEKRYFAGEKFDP